MLAYLTTILSLVAAAVKGAAISERQTPPCPDLYYCDNVYGLDRSNLAECKYSTFEQPGKPARALSCFYTSAGMLLFSKDGKLSDAYCPPTALPSPACRRAALIQPGKDSGKCLDVRGDIRQNGQPVQVYKCNKTPAQRWVYDAGPGRTSIRLAGTDFCLDAGTNPSSGTGMKIWKCYDNLAAQNWYITADKRLAVEGKGQCLDLTDGKIQDGVQTQTWACGNGNLNQVWAGAPSYDY